MHILLDECVPGPLKKEFRGHRVRTVRQMGWSGKRNGELLRLMADARIDVLVTVDKNLGYQQNRDKLGTAIIVLMGEGTKLNDLVPLMPAVRRALKTIERGQYLEVALPKESDD
jgi:PIN like domain